MEKAYYVVPAMRVDMADVAENMMVTSISVSDEPGSEQYAKEQAADGGGWDIDW